MTDADREMADTIDPATERLRRKMVRLLGVSIGIMFIGVMAVLVAVVYRTSDSSAPAQGAAIPLQLPAGAEIAETSLSGESILMRIFVPEGESLLVFDRASGTLVNTYPLQRR